MLLPITNKLRVPVERVAEANVEDGMATVTLVDARGDERREEVPVDDLTPVARQYFGLTVKPLVVEVEEEDEDEEEGEEEAEDLPGIWPAITAAAAGLAKVGLCLTLTISPIRREPEV